MPGIESKLDERTLTPYCFSKPLIRAGSMYSVQLKISRSPSILAGTTFVTAFSDAFSWPTPQPVPSSEAPSASPAPPCRNSRLRIALSITFPQSDRMPARRCRAPPPARRRSARAHGPASSPDRRRARAGRARRSRRSAAASRRAASRGAELAALDALLDRLGDPGVVALVQPRRDRAQLLPARRPAPQLQPQPPLAVAEPRRTGATGRSSSRAAAPRSSPRSRRASCGGCRAARTSARAPRASSASRVSKW